MTIPSKRISEYVCGRDKGLPGGLDLMPIDEVGRQAWNLLREDIPLPAAVIREDVLRANSRWMRRFTDSRGVELAPHGKTTMAPGLFDLQLDDGAWGLTLATPHQVQVAIDLGYKRIFVANQVIGAAALRFMLTAIERDPALELYCLVDSTEAVAQIEQVARALGQTRRLAVLVEKGFSGGRTGCRTVAATVALARLVAASDHLVLAGVEGFEALIRGGSADETLASITLFLKDVVAITEACDQENLFGCETVLMSAGGSAYFDLVATTLGSAKLRRPSIVLLRSGCYITHDAGLYTYAFTFLRKRIPDMFTDGGLRPALEVWGYVQSRPEVDRALVTIGKRDVSADQMPVPQLWYRPDGSMAKPASMPPGHAIDHLDDQHGYLKVDAGSPLRVGDMIGFGISHPCLTFDKWRVIHTVDGDYNITGSLRTYF